eukprot:117640-Chlamydomonas_euryale.AAC.1
MAGDGDSASMHDAGDDDAADFPEHAGGGGGGGVLGIPGVQPGYGTHGGGGGALDGNGEDAGRGAPQRLQRGASTNNGQAP